MDSCHFVEEKAKLSEQLNRLEAAVVMDVPQRVTCARVPSTCAAAGMCVTMEGSDEEGAVAAVYFCSCECIISMSLSCINTRCLSSRPFRSAR